MKWRCKRCEVVFDDSNKKCNCSESPSPWEPIPVVEIQFEKVEVKPRARKLEGEWTFELGPEEFYYYCEPTRWEKFSHWVKYLFVKGKVEKL